MQFKWININLIDVLFVHTAKNDILYKLFYK